MGTKTSADEMSPRNDGTKPKIKRKKSKTQAQQSLNRIAVSFAIFYNRKILQSTFFQIYNQELENIKNFDEFQDWITTYRLYRGKQLADSRDTVFAGKFKGAIKISRLPLISNTNLFEKVPANEPTCVLVRVYVVKVL